MYALNATKLLLEMVRNNSNGNKDNNNINNNNEDDDGKDNDVFLIQSEANFNT